MLFVKYDEMLGLYMVAKVKCNASKTIILLLASWFYVSPSGASNEIVSLSSQECENSDGMLSRKAFSEFVNSPDTAWPNEYSDLLVFDKIYLNSKEQLMFAYENAGVFEKIHLNQSEGKKTLLPCWFDWGDLNHRERTVASVVWLDAITREEYSQDFLTHVNHISEDTIHLLEQFLLLAGSTDSGHEAKRLKRVANKAPHLFAKLFVTECIAKTEFCIKREQDWLKVIISKLLQQEKYSSAESLLTLIQHQDHAFKLVEYFSKQFPYGHEKMDWWALNAQLMPFVLPVTTQWYANKLQHRELVSLCGQWVMALEQGAEFLWEPDYAQPISTLCIWASKENGLNMGERLKKVLKNENISWLPQVESGAQNLMETVK